MVETTAEGIGQEFLHRDAGEDTGAFQQRRAQAGDAIKVLPARQAARGINRHASLGVRANGRSRRSSSIDSPAGSMIWWQAAHCGFCRCATIFSRIETIRVFERVSSSGGTFDGGGGGGVPSSVSRIHLPRSTGDVRVA